MADDKNKTADWAPGTLENTRRNIGNLDKNEAAEMAKKLGGQVMYEKSSHTSSGASAGGSSKPNLGVIKRNPASGSSQAKPASASSAGYTAQSYHKYETLPEMSKKDCNYIDKLMMSSEFQIKPNYGFFNFIRSFQKNGTEKILPSLCDSKIPSHISNMESFITVIKTLIQMSPSTYKSKILNGSEAKFKFLRMVASWTMGPIKTEYAHLKDVKPPVLTKDLISITRVLYKPLITLYYFGDTKIPKLIKEIYNDEIAYPDTSKEKLSELSKKAITHWVYLDNEVIKKMYPLLMRMCGNGYYEYPEFFQTQISDILKFTELHKFDLLLPEKLQEKKVEEKKPSRPDPVQKGVKDATVITGLKLLEQFFPQAGFSNLEEHPDMYSYFGPIFELEEGSNLLHKENPLQVIIVLQYIIEYCFKGCRNIKFNVPDSTKNGADTIYNVMDEWSAYREEIFGKYYCDELKDFVNSAYSQGDFATTKLGKKILNSLLWQITFHFMPSFKFDQLLLERPQDQSKYRPLYHRTDFTRKYLTMVVNECDQAAKTKSEIKSISNPWDHYQFELPNEISKRLDVVLGGKNTGPNTNATNANLLKYTLCFVSVLDWYINNPDSPAYTGDPMNIYRVSSEDGKPQFSVKTRNDQNKLFAEGIKAAYSKQAK